MSDTSQQDGRAVDIPALMQAFMAAIRHSRVLGLSLERADDQGVMLRLPYAPQLVGNPETGVIHGGALTSLLDQACGMAVVAAMAPEVDIAPTLDLRIDYMRPATPGKDILAHARVFRLTRSIVFSRGVAYHEDDPDRPIAHSTGTFIRMGLQHVDWTSRPVEAH